MFCNIAHNEIHHCMIIQEHVTGVTSVGIPVALGLTITTDYLLDERLHLSGDHQQITYL